MPLLVYSTNRGTTRVCVRFVFFVFLTHNYIVPGCQTLIRISGAKANSCLEGDLSHFKEATERDAESC